MSGLSCEKIDLTYSLLLQEQEKEGVEGKRRHISAQYKKDFCKNWNHLVSVLVTKGVQRGTAM